MKIWWPEEYCYLYTLNLKTLNRYTGLTKEKMHCFESGDEKNFIQEMVVGKENSLMFSFALHQKSSCCLNCKFGFISSRSGTARLVCLTGIYTQKDPSNPIWMDWLLRPLARSFMPDMALMENIIMKSSLCYTIVRPPCLSEGTRQLYLQRC